MENHEDGGELWMVPAMIQPFKLDAVSLALEELPHFGGMTRSECRRFVRGKVEGEPGGPDRSQRSDVVDFTRKARLEIAVRGRTEADVVIETVARAAHTGNPGSGDHTTEATWM